MSRRRVESFGRRARVASCALPDDLYDYYTAEPEPRLGPPPVEDPKTWRVVDDWPDRVPVTEAEIEVFERWFADIFDELFGPTQPDEGLTMLSHYDNKNP